MWIGACAPSETTAPRILSRMIKAEIFTALLAAIVTLAKPRNSLNRADVSIQIGGALDTQSDYSFANRAGKVKSFTEDHMALPANPRIFTAMWIVTAAAIFLWK